MVPVDCGFPPGAVMFPTAITPRFNEFYDSLDLLLVPEESDRMRLGGPDCDTNRNRAIRNLSPDSRWVLFLDDDQVFPADILIRMLATMYGMPGIDALTGWYTKKTPPFPPILFRDGEGEYEFDRMMLSDVIEAKKHGPMLKVSACGGGILLVKRETLDRIGDPWFCPGPGRAWGGDIGFGKSMKEKGLSLWADLSLPIGHCMPSVITPYWDGEKLLFKFSFGDKSFSLDSSLFPEKRHTINAK